MKSNDNGGHDGTDEKNHKTLYCSFCGKSQFEVRKLIAGPSVFVCNECVLLNMIVGVSFVVFLGDFEFIRNT